MITMEQVSAEAGAFDRIEAAGGTEPMLEARERFTVGIDAIFAEFRHALYVVLRDAEKHGRERVEREGVVEAPEVAVAGYANDYAMGALAVYGSVFRDLAQLASQYDDASFTLSRELLSANSRLAGSRASTEAERRGAALALSVLVAGLGATVNPTTKEGL